MLEDYKASNITVLEGLEAVRKRPGMYIGDVMEKGFHHLVWEIVDNSIDEAAAGYCDRIEITVNSDKSVTVTDNGRGIPVDIHPTENIPALTVVLTVLHAGGKFDKNSYKVSGGLHGVGVSVVNALSEKLIATVKRDGKIYRQEFHRGIPVTELEVIGECGDETGTTIQFWPDFTIFSPELDFKNEILIERFKQLAYLNSGLTIVYRDNRINETFEYHFEDGLTQFVKDIANDILITDIIKISDNVDSVGVDVAFAYDNGSKNNNIYSFVNNIRTIEHGTHVVGFRTALQRAIIDYIKENGTEADKKLKISVDHVSEGLDAVVSVKVMEPLFEGQVKGKLGNSEVRPIVYKVVLEQYKRYLEENPTTAKQIMQKVILAVKAANAAERARDLTRKQEKNQIGTLPGKLTDCTSRKPEECELYLVEGDSAGGSAKQGRDRRIQAILPLKGKILNVEKSEQVKVLKSDEIKAIITALRTGVLNQFDIDKLRYHKIIIMTDADVDGSHIQTLILTLFFRYFKELVERGHLYIAQPPLYRYKKGKEIRYLKDDKDLYNYLLSKIDIDDREREELVEFKNIYDHMILKYGSRYIIDYIYKNSYVDKLNINEGFISYIESFSYNIVNRQIDGHLMKLYIQTENGLEYVEVNSNIIDDDGIKRLQELYNDLKDRYENPPKALEDMIENSKKGVYIQRYKGLGEMNPEQLWETTMDPEQRTLIQVTIEDIEKANEVFTTLMGDEVTNRRQFIIEKSKFIKEY